MTATTKALGGTFGPVHAPDGGLIDPTSFEMKSDGTERRLVDEDGLPEEYKEAINADDFIIYGKASVEQVDADGQIIDIDALEESLDQLFKANNISRRHKDVRVGEVLPKYTLEENTKFAVGDEMLEFSAGDTLTTHAEDDELWIVANLWNDSEIAKDTRLRTMAGDLNGFSVTIYAKETENRAEGEYVTDLDWHAVTIGSDEKIKNKESRFGLAEFKAMFGIGDTDEAVSPVHGQAEVSRDPVATTMWNGLLSKSADKAGFNGELMSAAAQAAQKAESEDVDLKEAAEEVASEDDDLEAKSIVDAVATLTGDGSQEEKADDAMEVLEAVEEGELTAEEAAEVMAEGSGGDDGGEEEEDDDGEMKEEEEDDDGEDDEDEKSFEEKLNEHGVVTEEQLDEKLDSATSEVEESVEETVKGLFDENIPTAEDVAEKMETGATSDPSGGSAQSGADYTSQIQEAFTGEGGDN